MKKVGYFIQEKKKGKWENITFPIAYKDIKSLMKQYQSWFPEEKFRPVKRTISTKIEVINV